MLQFEAHCWTSIGVEDFCCICTIFTSHQQHGSIRSDPRGVMRSSEEEIVTLRPFSFRQPDTGFPCITIRASTTQQRSILLLLWWFESTQNMKLTWVWWYLWSGRLGSLHFLWVERSCNSELFRPSSLYPPVTIKPRALVTVSFSESYKKFLLILKYLDLNHSKPIASPFSFKL